MIHIATIHWNSARWIAPQQAYLRKHLKSEFRIYAWLNNIPDAPRDGFYYTCTEPITLHAVKLNLLADIILATSPPDDDLLIFLDGDAFPIGDIESFIRPKLNGSKLAAVQRLENNGDSQPHPCFCAATVGFWRQIKGDWKEGYSWKNKDGEAVNDVGGNLLGQLIEHNIKWTPLLRSNRVNLHPLFFGLYENLIYHHGAGFRKVLCRLDLATAQSKPGNTLLHKLIPGYRRRQQAEAAKKLGKLAAQNDELSEQIYKNIMEDPQFYARFM